MKHYIYTLLILVLFSCDKEEPEKPNTPPKAFEVTANADGTNVTLTWTEAVDADGDAVSYAVVYGDTLAKGLTTRSFTIKDLPYETEIAGTVVASDGKGGKTESGFKVKTSESIFVNIPDGEFEKYLISQKIDNVLDGKVLKVEALKVTYLFIDSKEIQNLVGLEAFANLENLMIRTSKLKEISLKGLSKLLVLDIGDTDLTKVDLSGSPLLVDLGISANNVSEVDTRKNSRLQRLTCSGRGFQKIYVDNSPELFYLKVHFSDNLSPIDLSKNINLKELDFWNSDVEKWNLVNNTKLQNVRLVTRSVIDVDLTLPKSSPLKSLEMNNIKNFDKIDLSGFTGLIYLVVYGSSIDSINIRPLTKLVSLSLNNNKIQAIDLSGNTELTDVRLSNNKLTKLSLCSNLAIRRLECNNNDISTIYINKAHKPNADWQKDATATYKVCD